MNLIDKFQNQNFPSTLDGVNEANKIISEILTRAASLSLPLKKKFNRSKKKMSKKWFNKKCKLLRKEFRSSSNKLHKNPDSKDLIDDCNVKLKAYQSACNKAKNVFIDEKISELNENKNSPDFWKIWKTCNDNDSKSTKIQNSINWTEYYSKLFKKEENIPNLRNLEVNQVKKFNDNNLKELNQQIKKKEMSKILKKLKNGKAPGMDRILNEMIKYSYPFLKSLFKKLFNLIILSGKVPDIWCYGLVSPIHKSGDPLNPSNYRPICVISCLGKFFINILNSRLSILFKKKNMIHVSQIGFEEKHRTADHVFTLKTIVNNFVQHKPKGKIYACFVDFKKAYDSVWHKGLFHKLKNFNIQGSFLKIIEDIYSKSFCAVKINNQRTNFFPYEKGVRQGCPLSPILFNFYINDSAFQLDKKTDTSKLLLPNNAHITCLMYADDIVIISLSPIDLQSNLNTLQEYCLNWMLNINTEKTKCITFQKKNRKNSSNSFFIGDEVLSNVAEFKYLGFLISANGSLKPSMENLSIKANKAIFAINNRIKFKKLQPSSALKIFDTAVLPILTYGSEVWGAFLNLDYDKWDSSDCEKIHIRFCKHILGVNRQTPNLLCRSELGRYPIKTFNDTKIINFFKHIKELPADSVAHQALKLDQITPSTDTLSNYITNLHYTYGQNIMQLSKPKLKKKLKDSYEAIWNVRMYNSTRGKYFQNFKKNISFETYLDTINNRKHRVCLSKFRLSDHNLMIEKGRKLKLEKHLRTCKMCEDDIEDETHFIFECPKLNTNTRTSFLKQLDEKYQNLKNLDNYNKLIFLLINESSFICRLFSKYIFDMSEKRTSLLLMTTSPNP